ncbi:MAG TPA: 4'-phosphopantetheinyl transferase superfamily protein [Anaerolineales bacterium]|nr:4'-phosphopantetheinyl transferase superfamily protein [Anaerolineales bacterium]
MPSLVEGDVHLWLADLDLPPEKAASISEFLSDDEIARANRLRSESSRQHFLVRRGILRLLSGKYLSISPERVEFRVGLHGKPGLSDHHANARFKFNLSSTGSVALFGFCMDKPVGVDIERVDEDFDYQGVVSSYFSEEEQSKLQSLDPDQRRLAFYTIWVRMEAYLKGLGTGFSHSAHMPGISMAADQHHNSSLPSMSPLKMSDWLIYDLKLPAGYVGAFAVLGQFKTLQCWKNSA